MFQQEVIDAAGQVIKHMKTGKLYFVIQVKHTKVSGAWETLITYADIEPMLCVQYERRANDFEGFELI